jgi:Protein of unknown function
MAAYRRLLARHRRLIRRVAVGSGIFAAVLVFGLVGLWWRLASGPIPLDIVTPWLASAIADNFGSRDHVEVGGTQIERTENGGAAVRMRDIVVRDADGAVVASAPKAEVRLSALSLLTGHLRAESLNLVGAKLHVRIERDGEVVVFAGADKHPIATAAVPVTAIAEGRPVSLSQAARSSKAATSGAVPSAHNSPHRNSAALAALLAWLDGIGKTGLDGHDLHELGLKRGTLKIDDERSGKQWALSDITLSLERSRGGGIVVKLGSKESKRAWGVVASIKPIRGGFHSVAFEARHVAAEDLLRLVHFGDGSLQTTVPLSARIAGVIGRNGVPEALSGQIVAGAGSIGDSDSTDGRIDIDRAEFKFDWDSASRLLTVPFQILSGGDRITLLGQIEAPNHAGAPWSFKVGGGTLVLASPDKHREPLILNRIAVRGSFDPTQRRLVLDTGDFGNTDVSVAMSGSAVSSDGDWQLNAGFAGKRISVEDLKRLWPVFVAPKVRDWVNQRLLSGAVDHITVAVNAPLKTLRASGPPIPDNGLSVDAAAADCVIRPIDGLPALRDADMTVHIVGRHATVAVGKATADLPSGRKFALSSGLFDVPDTAPHAPPTHVHFKLDGPAAGVAELLAMDRLRGVSGMPLDPATTHGTISAQVVLAMPLKPELTARSTDYSITADATDFSAEHMIMGQPLDAAVLHVTATQKGFQLKGRVKIAGAPATLEYRKMRGDSDAEISIDGSLDAAARRKLGLDSSKTIDGSIPIQVVGRVDTASDNDGVFAVTADLTSAQIDGFLPGWIKPAGKPARATMTITTAPQSIKVDNLVIEGVGRGVKGSVELDGSGELQSANFRSYGFSDGDKATLKVDRAADGALRVTVRGDVYDGRHFIKDLSGGLATAKAGKQQPPDIDLDVKLGAVLAFNGEALTKVDLKISRRAGELRSLGLRAKIGRAGTLTGELRSQPDGRQVVYLKTSDAGAVFRATDIYSRMVDGNMVVVMGLPTADNPVQHGSLEVRNFKVHDETELQRAATAQGGNEPPHGDLNFTSMRVDFTRVPGRVALRDGVVRGPVLGGTIDGIIDYSRDAVDLRGTLVPLYGPNNLFGWLPVVGPILGGSKEGVFGFTYQVVGRPGRPVLNVNLLSVLAPGVLRQIFQYPAAATTATGSEARPTTGGLGDNR